VRCVRIKVVNKQHQYYVQGNLAEVEGSVQLTSCTN
jgi:hypothetical protein